MKVRNYLVPVLGTLFVLATSTQAQRIEWGGSFGPSLNLESDADALENDIGDVTFELGIFTNGFTPTRDNLESWATNWLAFPGQGVDTEYNDDGSTGSTSFGGIVGFGPGVDQASNATYAVGSQVYIWGYNTQDISQTPEWFLATGEDGSAGTTDQNWLTPAEQSGNGGFDFIWDINNASTAVVGRIDDTTTPTPGISDAPVLGLDDLQFEVVPEPSSLLLTFLGLACCLRRNRS